MGMCISSNQILKNGDRKKQRSKQMIYSTNGALRRAMWMRWPRLQVPLQYQKFQVFGLRVKLMGTHCGGESGRGPKSLQTAKDDTLWRPTAKAKTLQRMSRRRGNTCGCWPDRKHWSRLSPKALKLVSAGLWQRGWDRGQLGIQPRAWERSQPGLDQGAGTDVIRAADWEPLADVAQASEWEPLAGVDCSTAKEAGTGVGWSGNTRAGTLGRHSSGALNSSEDDALGRGVERQNRERDLNEPGHRRMDALSCGAAPCMPDQFPRMGPLRFV